MSVKVTQGDVKDTSF